MRQEPNILVRRTASATRAYLWQREERNRRYELKVGDEPSQVLDRAHLFAQIPGRVHTTDFHDCVAHADRLADAGDRSTWVVYGWA